MEKENLSKKLSQEVFYIARQLTMTSQMNQKKTPEQVKEDLIFFLQEEFNELDHHFQNFLDNIQDLSIKDILLEKNISDLEYAIAQFRQFALTNYSISSNSILSATTSETLNQHIQLQQKLLDAVMEKYMKEGKE